MEKTIRFTKQNPFTKDDKDRSRTTYEFAVYKTSMLFPVNLTYASQQHDGFVDVGVFGLIVRQLKELEGKVEESEYDVGPLSAQGYHLNYLVQMLCRHPIEGKTYIYSMIERETSTWNHNRWGNPFGQAAEQRYKEKFRALRSSNCESTDYPRKETNREKRLRKANPFKRHRSE